MSQLSRAMQDCVDECLRCYAMCLQTLDGMEDCVAACRRCAESCRKMAA